MGRKLVKIPHYSLFGTWDASLLNLESSEQSMLASGSQGLSLPSFTLLVTPIQTCGCLDEPRIDG